ncbi:thioesterase family protein [Halalkalibacter kiskunsagensis]|uniref:Thioesterase family protein n=1 Tax=Halalkalibacter kiskunsagensis TaxID=1548599 RepID=A0ABV6K885_9BACI
MKIPSYIENINEWKEKFIFSIPVKVRFSETDAFGHVNNTSAFVYFEEARMEFFKHLGFMQKWASVRYETMIVVADLQCDYIKQMTFDQKLSVSIHINHISRSSLDLHYMVVNENAEFCLTGRGTVVQISKNTGRSIPWDDEMKMVLEKELE